MEETIKLAVGIKFRLPVINHQVNTRKVIFFFAVALCLSPLITPPIALFMGLLMAQFVKHPYLHRNQQAIQVLLKASVVGLGFGMNVNNALKAGKEGFLFTVVSIVGTLLFGILMGKLLKIDKKTSYLVSAGTAICGGSAIAAISPTINAKEKQISVALGTVFILNAIALLLFPIVGHALHLSQNQFGLWCAIAIHDTSSVVGAASKYGAKALEVATTVKLARALWIVPFAFLSTLIFKTKGAKIKIPYFIGLFIIAVVMNTYIPFISSYSHYVIVLSKAGLTLTLFLIGYSLSRDVLQSVGFRPLIQGIVLWVVISAAALWAIISLAA
jgi:uncharacterized integral membrane protein (TIGR00698 family)